MNVLVINPNKERMPWPAVPVGLCTVASSLEAAGHEVTFLDLTFSSNHARATRGAVRRHEPEVIAVTIRNIDNCNFELPHFYLEEIRDQVIRVARETRPGAKIVIGGSAVNVSPADCFDYLQADYALVGEGELAMVQLCEAFEGKRPLAGVSG